MVTLRVRRQNRRWNRWKQSLLLLRVLPVKGQTMLSGHRKDAPFQRDHDREIEDLADWTRTAHAAYTG
jgi:hypothetical protein